MSVAKICLGICNLISQTPIGVVYMKTSITDQSNHYPISNDSLYGHELHVLISAQLY